MIAKIHRAVAPNDSNDNKLIITNNRDITSNEYLKVFVLNIFTL